MSDTKREKNSRPFYELPAHIKPCSTIIKETRMQLRYSGKLGSLSSGEWGEGSLVNPSGSPSNDFASRTSDLANISANPSGSQGGYGGIRPVNTKRPNTPRDSVSLWGTSARKRPPSAITLSRLSLDDIEEKRPESTKLRPLVSKPLTGKVLDSSHSVDNDVIGGHAKEMERYKMTTRLKSLSLHNIKNEQELVTELEDKSEVIGERRSKSSGKGTRNSDGEKGRSNVNSNSRQNVQETHFLSTTATTTSLNFDETGDCSTKIDGLEGAVSYLASCSRASGQPQKSEVINALKKIKENIEIVNSNEDAKGKVLKLVFKVVERNQSDEDILFWASFVLLHCHIIGNNLTTIFKMVFKASRSKEYWSVIKETEYLDVFMESFTQICPKSQTESMIYGYGTLKFICMEPSVLLQVVDLNLVPVMTLHLNILNYEVTQLKKIPENIFNGAFQLTSILRSVVGEEGCLDSVAKSGLLEELCSSLVWTIEDIDVLTNVVRILSVVSGDDVCSELISSHDYICEAIVKILQTWYAKEDVVVRLTYCLGNLLSKSDEMRIKLYQEPGAFRLILDLISLQMENPNSTSEDIMIKSVRSIANWTLNMSIGNIICDDSQLCELLNSILQAKDVSDELLQCVIATLNNTSFYKQCDSLDETTINTAESLYNYLNNENIDVRTEAMKVLGNLTRSAQVRQSSSEYVDVLLESLEEENDELLCATIGVLMNIMIEEKVKAEFISKNGLDRMISLFQSKEDVVLNLMICQLLWNLFYLSEVGMTSATSRTESILISDEKRLELGKVLKNKLQRRFPAKMHESQVVDTEFDIEPYQELQSVATNLMKLIQK